MKIEVGVSNRHVHLTEEAYEYLFGNMPFLKEKALKQPGHFASNLKLTIKTDKNSIENVRVLGPFRSYNQVEISKTDAYKLGINPPVRKSGDLANSAPITLIGPNGELNLTEGCIIATRHIHITPKELEKLGLTAYDVVSVKIGGEKGGIIDDVFFSVDASYVWELHIDTDDANGHLLKQSAQVEVMIDKGKSKKD